MEPNNMNMNKSTPEHNSCDTCGACTHCGEKHGMKRYLIRHFLVLILGVLLAFWVGMQLGEIKGYMKAGAPRGGFGGDRWDVRTMMYR